MAIKKGVRATAKIVAANTMKKALASKAAKAAKPPTPTTALTPAPPDPAQPSTKLVQVTSIQRKIVFYRALLGVDLAGNPLIWNFAGAIAHIKALTVADFYL